MKCLMKYQWVKLPRNHLPEGKGIMSAWAKLASSAAFRKGQASYCGHINAVSPGMWSGGVVGLKSILGYRSRAKSLDTLSKGNQQKIQLITALAHDPDIIILDEPFSGLDPVNAMLLKDVVKEQIAKGKIVLFSSHQMSYIEEFCDSIAILNNGVVALHGDLHDIKRDYPRDRLVVRTESPDAIISDFASSCTVMENGDLMIRLGSPSEKKTTMTRLVENYDIDEVKVFEPSLNDIFVEYAGDAAKED